MQTPSENQPEAKVVSGPRTTWQGAPTTVYEGPIQALQALIPTFTRQPFKIGEGENPNLDVLLREPVGAEQQPPIPVSTVSKQYQLIQHLDVVQAVVESFDRIGLDYQQHPTRLSMTDLGERLLLDFHIAGYDFNPGDGYPVTLKAFVVNSVDRSFALNVHLAWMRLICMNGVMMEFKSANYRRIHNVLLPERENITTFLHHQIGELSAQRRVFLTWGDTPIDIPQIDAWADEVLARHWGNHAAARACHIARTGSDGRVTDPFEKKLPHQHRVGDERQVPGARAPISNLYHLSQVLSWIASRERVIERRLERMSEISRLVETVRPQAG